MVKKYICSFYEMICDICGNQLSPDKYLEYSDLEKLIKIYNWKIVGEKHYCQKCAKEVEFDLYTVI